MKNLRLVFVSIACVGLYYESAQLKLFAMENKGARNGGEQFELTQVVQEREYLKGLLEETSDKGRISRQNRLTGTPVAPGENEADTLLTHFLVRHAAVNGTPIVDNEDHPSLVDIEENNEEAGVAAIRKMLEIAIRLLERRKAATWMGKKKDKSGEGYILWFDSKATEDGKVITAYDYNGEQKQYENECDKQGQYENKCLAGIEIYVQQDSNLVTTVVPKVGANKAWDFYKNEDNAPKQQKLQKLENLRKEQSERDTKNAAEQKTIREERDKREAHLKEQRRNYEEIAFRVIEELKKQKVKFFLDNNLSELLNYYHSNTERVINLIEKEIRELQSESTYSSEKVIRYLVQNEISLICSRFDNKFFNQIKDGNSEFEKKALIAVEYIVEDILGHVSGESPKPWRDLATQLANKMEEKSSIRQKIHDVIEIWHNPDCATSDQSCKFDEQNYDPVYHIMSLKTNLKETSRENLVEQILNNKASLSSVIAGSTQGSIPKIEVSSITKAKLNGLKKEYIMAGNVIARLQPLNNIRSVFGNRFDEDKGLTFIRLPNGWRCTINSETYCNQCALLALGLPPEEAKAISTETRRYLHDNGGIAIDDVMWEWIAYNVRRRIITYERNVNGSIYQVVHGAGLPNGTEVRRVFLEGNHYEPLLTPEQAQEWIRNNGWYGRQQ